MAALVAALARRACSASSGVEPDLVDYVLAFIIALFLWIGRDRRDQRRAGAPAAPGRWSARDLARRTLAVPGDLPLAEAVRRAQDAEAGGIVTVTSAGAPVGAGQRGRRCCATPEDRRPWVATSTVARATWPTGLRLPADIAGEDLVRAITRTPATEYLLVEADGSIYGVLTTADVDRAFREAGS